MKLILSTILYTFLLLSQSSHAAINQAPDINLPGVNGEIHLHSLKGKVIYLDFWASWCLPCKKSFPWMNEMKKNYGKQGFEILAVNLDKDKKLADEFLEEMDVNFQVAFDEEGKSASDYKLRGMPSSYLIGRDGKVFASHVGFRDKDKAQLEQAIKNLLERYQEK